MKKSEQKGNTLNKIVAMTLINPFSAGIDIIDKEHVIAIAEGLADERIRAFGTMTCDLEAISNWLYAC